MRYSSVTHGVYYTNDIKLLRKAINVSNLRDQKLSVKKTIKSVFKISNKDVKLYSNDILNKKFNELSNEEYIDLIYYVITNSSNDIYYINDNELFIDKINANKLIFTNDKSYPEYYYNNSKVLNNRLIAKIGTILILFILIVSSSFSISLDSNYLIEQASNFTVNDNFYSPTSNLFKSDSINDLNKDNFAPISIMDNVVIENFEVRYPNIEESILNNSRLLVTDYIYLKNEKRYIKLDDNSIYTSNNYKLNDFFITKYFKSIINDKVKILHNRVTINNKIIKLDINNGYFIISYKLFNMLLDDLYNSINVTINNNSSSLYDINFLINSDFKPTIKRVLTNEIIKDDEYEKVLENGLFISSNVENPFEFLGINSNNNYRLLINKPFYQHTSNIDPNNVYTIDILNKDDVYDKMIFSNIFNSVISNVRENDNFIQDSVNYYQANINSDLDKLFKTEVVKGSDIYKESFSVSTYNTYKAINIITISIITISILSLIIIITVDIKYYLLVHKQ